MATPLHWDELHDPHLDPQGWTTATLADRGDPWQEVSRHARGLGPAGRALATHAP